MAETKDVTVSSEVYWALVKKKQDGEYRSIDEVIRPMLGMCAGPRSRLKSYTRRMEDMTMSLSRGVVGMGCPAAQSPISIRYRRPDDEAMISYIAGNLSVSTA